MVDEATASGPGPLVWLHTAGLRAAMPACVARERPEQGLRRNCRPPAEGHELAPLPGDLSLPVDGLWRLQRQTTHRTARRRAGWQVLITAESSHPSSPWQINKNVPLLFFIHKETPFAYSFDVKLIKLYQAQNPSRTYPLEWIESPSGDRAQKTHSETLISPGPLYVILNKEQKKPFGDTLSAFKQRHCVHGEIDG